MKLRRIIAALLLFSLLLPISALADEHDPIPDEDRFGGKDWDAVMEEFIKKSNVNPDSIGVAYYNTETG